MKTASADAPASPAKHAAQLPAEQGFQLKRQKGVGEERILSSNADGLRVLASQIQYRDI